MAEGCNCNGIVLGILGNTVPHLAPRIRPTEIGDVWMMLEGIAVNAMYSQAELDQLAFLDTFPGSCVSCVAGLQDVGFPRPCIWRFTSMSSVICPRSARLTAVLRSRTAARSRVRPPAEGSCCAPDHHKSAHGRSCSPCPPLSREAVAEA